ncbi:MAG: VWA domain-containing protein [Flavobacteriales bacterium]|nr:VWA domain-containing protein [Flavobacteriales bacterium]
MFRFEHPYLLYLLLLIPFLWILQFWITQVRKKKLATIIDKDLRSRLIPMASSAKAWLKLSVYTLAFATLILGIANPQFGSKTEEVKRKGIDLMIALDISNSMLAEDLSPNRLKRSKRSMEELLGYLKSDRIGIVVFAGEAFVQLPITTDYSAAKLFLRNIETELITTQGTDIGNAIDLCMRSFDFDSPTSKAIVVISDGENHEESSLKAAEEAAAQGVVIHSIGMGSAEGAPIPIYQGGKRVGFKKSKEGNTVVTKLDEQMLAEIANASDGVFVRASNGESGMRFIFDEVERMEKVEIGTRVYTDYEDRFQYLLLPALLLLIIELIIPNTRTPWWEKLFAS